MKFILILISFLFFAALATNTQVYYDAPGEKLCVVDVPNDLLDISMTSIEVDLIAELKLLDQGSTIVITEGISPPGVKPLMIIQNNKLKFGSMSVVINPTIEKDAYTTTEKGHKLLKNRMGLSSGGSAGEPHLRA